MNKIAYNQNHKGFLYSSMVSTVHQNNTYIIAAVITAAGDWLSVDFTQVIWSPQSLGHQNMCIIYM